MSCFRRILIGVLDYAMLVLAAFIGALVVTALMLWRHPEPERIVNSGLPLVLGATAATVVIFWFGLGRFFRRGWARVVTAALIVGLGACAGFWMDSALSSYSRVSRLTEMVWTGVQVAAFLLILAGLFVARCVALERNKWSPGLRLGLAVALVGGVVYLKRDESVSPVVGRNEAALAGRNADEATYRLTLRYSSGADGGGVAFEALKNNLSFPSERAKRIAYLLAHRAEIESSWDALAGVRAWWAEMAAHDGLADRTSWELDQSFIRFAPVRSCQQTALAMAELQALDGDGDGAMARAMEVYKVGASLERPACTLVRGMIAVVVQKGALTTANFILDGATVSQETRMRFADLVDSSPAGSSGIGEMLLSEAMYASSSIRNISRLSWAEPSDGWHKSLFTGLGAGFRWLAFNSQATINLAHERMTEAARLADARDLNALRELDRKMNEKQLGGFQVKNIAGRMLIPMMSPAFEGIAKSFWEKEDLRAGLVSRLRGRGEAE